MRVRILYIEGCPSYEAAKRNLREALDELNLTTEVESVRIDSMEQAAAHMFLGSPTIQIDDEDIEIRSATDLSVGMCCRLYRQGLEVHRSPTKQMIRRAIEQRAFQDRSNGVSRL